MSNLIPYKEPKRSRNYQWERTQLAINQFIRAYLTQYKRLPLLHEIAEGIGMHEKTVRRHMKSINLARSTGAVKALAPDTLLGLAVKAMTGDAKHVKLFWELVMGWNPKLGQQDGQSVKDLAEQLRRMEDAMDTATENMNGVQEAEFEAIDPDPFTETVDPDPGS